MVEIAARIHSRRFLNCNIPAALVTLILLSLEGTGTLAEDRSPPAREADASGGSAKARPAQATNDEALLRPHVIIAKHVLLWDNQVVTWDEVLERFRKLRPRGPLHPSFHFTNGVHENEQQNWDYWHDEIMEAYPELFEPAGVTFASISPRGGRRYDRVRTEDDLHPDPALARTGRVRTPEGKPAADAQVIVLPLEDDPGVATLGVALEGKQLRDRFDEAWVASDEDGQFTIHPTDDTYFLVVLHEAGVRVLAPKTEENNLQVQLDRWAMVAFLTTGDLPGQSGKLFSQSAGLSIRPAGVPPECPEITIYEVRTEGQPVSVPVPPGRIVVRRTLDMGDGSSIGLPAGEFAIEAGAEHELAIEPATIQDELGALEERERFRQRD